MINEMEYICDNEYDRFFNLPNVNGIGIGYKEIGGIDTQQICLKVFVKEKVSLDSLNEDEVIPKSYKGFITDVLEIGEIIPFTNSNKYRPAPGGCQVQPLGAGFVGTFGCLASNKSGTDLTTYVLSNNHVLAGTNFYPIGTTIVQPSGTVSNAIANLSDYVPINFAPGSTNLVDCAIAKVIDLSLVTRQMLTIGDVIGPGTTGIASAQIGGFVQKYGRTTNYTSSTINAINSTVAVNYGASGVATFVKQIVAGDMSAPGDSGSIVMDGSNRVVGLLFAGSVGSSTIMNDIRYVLQSFRARLA